jgi:hypothetical protein
MEPEGDVLAVQVLQGRKQDGAMASGQVLQGAETKGGTGCGTGGGGEGKGGGVRHNMSLVVGWVTTHG